MLSKINHLVCKIEEYITVIIYAAMILVAMWIVVCRYVLNIPFTIGEELARYLMIYGVFIGVSIGVRRKSHLGVEAFVNLLPDKAKPYADLFKEVFSGFMYLILAWLSFLMIMQFQSTGQLSTMMRVPMYLIYVALPVGFLLSFLHTIQVTAGMLADMRKG